MSLLIQSAEGVVRKDGGSGGGGGGCRKKKSQLKLKNATKWNKDECSTEPQTEYKRQSCEIYMAGRRVEQNAKLQTLPVTHNTDPDLEPTDHPRTFRDQANCCALSCSPRQQETGRHKGKKPSPIFNKIWCYFSHVCNAFIIADWLSSERYWLWARAPTGTEEKETEAEGVGCYQQVICVWFKKNALLPYHVRCYFPADFTHLFIWINQSSHTSVPDKLLQAHFLQPALTRRDNLPVTAGACSNMTSECEKNTCNNTQKRQYERERHKISSFVLADLSIKD